MLTPDLRRKVDALWNRFWAGGLANPLTAIDQMNYLIFLKRLEDHDAAVFDGAERCRWSFWRDLPAAEMLGHINTVVFPWLKRLAPDSHAFTQYLDDAAFLVQKPSLLAEAVRTIDELAISEQNVDTQGDIYEYMLGRLSVAGQIGQFRTPRHIIRAMVAIADPRPGENVVDPACGTGGFLIAAALPGTRLEGYDFDPSMVRIASMNMVLHGLDRPRIGYADALGKGFDHTPRADVVLANPPFSGTVDASEVSGEFAIRTRKSELLFVQLFEDLLRPGGRAVVIVPLGVLLNDDEVPLAIRRRLLDHNTLDAVISLPHSTFKPYASVATAILVFRRGGTTERVWMYRVDRDGFTQNAARTPIDEDDLPDLVGQWLRRLSRDYEPRAGKHRFVSRAEIAERHFELSPSLYLAPERHTHDYPTKTLAELCVLRKGTVAAAKAPPGGYRLVTTSEEPRTADTYDCEGEAVCVPLVSSTGHGHASIKRLTYVPGGRFAAATIVAVLQVHDPAQLSARYLYSYLEALKDEVLVPLMRGAANVSLSLKKLGSIELPVPPLDEQLDIIAGLREVETALAQVELERAALRTRYEEEFALLRTMWSGRPA